MILPADLVIRISGTICIQWITIYKEPVLVGRVFPVLHHIHEWEEATTAVSEDAIQDDPDIVSMSCFYKGMKIIQRPKFRVNLLIIAGVVAMRGSG